MSTATREELRHFDRLIDQLGTCLTPETARKILELRADDAFQARLDDLADRNTEGALTAEELAEYDNYLRWIDVITILQSKSRVLLAESRNE
jgi:hypothetical protein